MSLLLDGSAGITAPGFKTTGPVTMPVWRIITSDPNPAVPGVGYMCNTAGGAITVTLPSTPNGNDAIYFSDYAGTFSTNALTVANNGVKIEGVADNIVATDNYASFGLIYIDSVKGWILQ